MGHGGLVRGVTWTRKHECKLHHVGSVAALHRLCSLLPQSQIN